MLMVTVLLSIFAFSAYNGNAQPKARIVQTELLFSGKKVLKRCISYKKAIALGPVDNDLNKDIKREINALFIYNRLRKVKFDVISAQCYAFKIEDSFVQIKTTPQDIEEEPISLLIG